MDTLEQQFTVRGMTCGSCVAHVRQALEQVPGVTRAVVRVGAATVSAQTQMPALADLRAAVAQAGYELVATPSQSTPSATSHSRVVRPVLIGIAGGLGLIGFYLGIITLAQGWSHAVAQLAADRWFVAAIVAGFGIQAGLFAYLRGVHVQMRAGGVAATTGTSTAAMLACCAHHLVDIAPILGLSGAVVVLNAYKTPLLWLGIVMNMAGIGFMLAKIRQHRHAACLPTADGGEWA